MAVGYVVAAVVAAMIAVFALQNGEPTSIRFLKWSVDAVPLAGVVLAALGAGLVVAGLPLWVQVWRWRSRARSAEARATSLEKTVADRDQALLRQKPPSTRGGPPP